MAGFSQSLETSLQKSIDYAAKKNHEHVTVEHLLLALIDDIDASNLLKACNIDLSILRNDLIKFIDDNPSIQKEVKDCKNGYEFSLLLKKYSFLRVAFLLKTFAN